MTGERAGKEPKASKSRQPVPTVATEPEQVLAFPQSTLYLAPSNILRLQRTIGNAAVQRLVASKQISRRTAYPPLLLTVKPPAGHEVQRSARVSSAWELQRCEECENKSVEEMCPACQAVNQFSEALAGAEANTTTLQRQAGGAVAPNPDPRCNELLRQIRDFLFGNDNMKGLIQRAQELIDDVHGLQWDFWRTPHPQFGSVEGHQQQFRNMQQGLRNRLDEWNSRTCDDPDGPTRLPERVWEWATRPAPNPAPRPRPQAPRVEGEGINWRRVFQVVIAIGLTIAMVAVVIAALLDPEPATKLALAGLSVVMIAMVLEAFGKGGGGQTG